MDQPSLTGGPADLLITGGSVISTALGGPAVRADLAVRDGLIVATGEDLTELRGPATQCLEVPGAVITPGLVDGHSHPVMGLELADAADLNHCRTLPEVMAVLAAHAERHAGDEWLTAWGLDPNVFEQGRLHREPIELAVGGRPTLVHLFDGHAAIATGSALNRAGIVATRPTVRGADAGTGVLQEEAAVERVAGLIPVAAFAVRRRQLARLLAQMAATGLTGAHVMDAKDDALGLVAALDADSDLPVRLRLAPWLRPGDPPEVVVQAQGLSGTMWRVAGVKFFLDGTIDGGTAWLDHPDALGGSTEPLWDPEVFARRIATFHANGIPTATHAIGDAAARHVLDVLAGLPAREHGPRHRIEHLETMPDDLLPRFAAAGVTASMQATHATDYTRADRTDNWSTRVGPARAALGWRCADVVRSGGNLVLGSDWPVASYDVRAVLASARSRRSVRDPDRAPVQPEQGLTGAQALHAVTAAPAWVSRSNGGRIAVGAEADLTVLADDPRRVPADELPQLPVLATVSGGIVRHRAV